MRSQRSNALACPASAVACEETVAVQDAGDEIVIGTERNGNDGGSRQHPDIRTRPRSGSGGLVGGGAKAGNDRRQAQTPGIIKRGNGYLGKMLIHGARAALPTLSKGETPLGAWLRGLLARAHVNTEVALAAKLAQIAWAVSWRGETFNMKLRQRRSSKDRPGALTRRGLRVVEGRWPDSRSAFWKPAV
jgi:hypothetical protein